MNKPKSIRKTNKRKTNKRKTNKHGKKIYGKGPVISKFIGLTSDNIPSSFSNTSIDIEKGNPPRSEQMSPRENNRDHMKPKYNVYPIIRTHSFDSMSSTDSDDPELTKIFESEKNRQYHGPNHSPLIVRQRLYSPFGKHKDRRSNSAPTYYYKTQDEAERGHSGIHYLTPEEREVSPNLTHYLEKIKQPTTPPHFGGLPKKQKTSRKQNKKKRRTKKRI